MFTWTCAGLLTAPAVVLAVAGVSFVLTADEALRGPARICAAVGLFGSLSLVIVEYYVVVRRSRRATSLIAYLALNFAMLGSVAWFAGLLDVLQLRSPAPNSISPLGFGIYSVFLAGLATVGLGHLRWLRLLKAAPREIVSQNE
jgi:hypothetical protein